MDLLREAAGEGRLTLEELTDRIEAAVNAVTRSELALLTGDLSGGTTIVVATQAEHVRGWGNVRRSGRWTVAGESSFRTWAGHIKLDLREAQLSAAETHIHVRALLGDITVLVPDGIAVELRARTRLGRTSLQASAAPGAPRIVLTGGTFSGSITVRHPRLWERLRRPGRRLLGRAQRQI